MFTQVDHSHGKVSGKTLILMFNWTVRPISVADLHKKISFATPTKISPLSIYETLAKYKVAPSCNVGSRISQRRSQPLWMCQPIIWPNFTKNSMKVKRYGPRGERSSKILLCSLNPLLGYVGHPTQGIAPHLHFLFLYAQRLVCDDVSDLLQCSRCCSANDARQQHKQLINEAATVIFVRHE